jgi:hypothetical protein
MSTKRDPTLSQLIMSRTILRLMFIIVAVSIIGLLILLWIELTNPKLLESVTFAGLSGSATVVPMHRQERCGMSRDG